MSHDYRDEFEKNFESGMKSKTGASISGMTKNLRTADGYSDLNIQLIFNGWQAGIAFRNEGLKREQDNVKADFLAMTGLLRDTLGILEHAATGNAGLDKRDADAAGALFIRITTFISGNNLSSASKQG